MSVDTEPLRKIIVKLKGLENLDPQDCQDLGRGLQRVIIEDNRRGVLSGFDKDGNFAPTLKYRNGTGTPTSPRAMRSKAFGTTSGTFKGVSQASGDQLANNNLSKRAYRQLTGPRLAPRREQSRVITNLVALPLQVESDSINVTCAWFDVISVKSVPFLKAHFEGSSKTNLPAYDLRGIRPWGMMEARNLVKLWIHSLITAKD